MKLGTNHEKATSIVQILHENQAKGELYMKKREAKRLARIGQKAIHPNAIRDFFGVSPKDLYKIPMLGDDIRVEDADRFFSVIPRVRHKGFIDISKIAKFQGKKVGTAKLKAVSTLNKEVRERMVEKANADAIRTARLMAFIEQEYKGEYDEG